MNNLLIVRIITFIVFMFLANTLFAQNKINIKKHKIKSSIDYDIKLGKNVLDKKEIYDANGEVIEEYSYNKDGKLKSGHKYKRKADGDIIEEIEIGENGKVKEKRIVKHNENGDKIEEDFYNASNKFTKKNIYVYDSKGLKVERKTYDDKGKLKSMKKFVYE